MSYFSHTSIAFEFRCWLPTFYIVYICWLLISVRLIVVCAYLFTFVYIIFHLLLNLTDFLVDDNGSFIKSSIIISPLGQFLLLQFTLYNICSLLLQINKVEHLQVINIKKIIIFNLLSILLLCVFAIAFLVDILLFHSSIYRAFRQIILTRRVCLLRHKQVFLLNCARSKQTAEKIWRCACQLQQVL